MVRCDNCTSNDWSFDVIVKIRPPVLSHCEHVTHVKCFLKHVQTSLEYKRSNPKTGLQDVEIKCPAAFCKVKFRVIEDVQVKPRSRFQIVSDECITYKHQQSGSMTLANTPVWSEDPINRGHRKLAKISCVVASEIDEESNEHFLKLGKPLTLDLVRKNTKLQKSAKEGKRLNDEQGGNANKISLSGGTRVEFCKRATDKDIVG
ncbi:unnamed protein product [Allacma fusca]|uniref:Uncharacterized protein n=1 Tax=Allacma fusca TaxID=39272 RepID=A0A8J2KUH0_9HEXA|nr:unnamed protein product [Allacma fusca]